MHYLLEIARELRPCVLDLPPRDRRTSSSCPTTLERLRDACDDAFCEHEARCLRDREAARKPAPVGGRRHPAVSDQAGMKWPTWADTGELRADEILADVLARNAHLIPKALFEAGSAFYPPFLTYLLDTAVESAQPAYRPHSAGSWIWWHVWTWFAAREYVALLRDRHSKVAAVLADTRSWKRPGNIGAQPGPAHPPDVIPSAGSAGGFTVSILGTGEILPTAQRAATRAGAAWQILKDAVARGPRNDEWRRCAEVLMKGGPLKEEFLGRLRRELLEDLDLVRRLANVSGAAVPFDLTFDLELSEIAESRPKRRRPGDPDGNDTLDPGNRYAPSAAGEMNLLGLAFSGGGIRSATFNLGVLQGLANTGLLRRVDYLSTVSGGGYIGAWLATWIKRSHAGPEKTGVCEVERRLRGEPLPSPDEEGVRAVRFLREYSNYLTPRTGFFSADTWTMAAIWVRNTLLNQCVLVMTLASLLMIPWMIWAGQIVMVPRPGGAPAGLFASAPVSMRLATILLLAASGVTGWQLRRYHLRPADRQRAKEDMLGQAGVLSWIVLPVIVGLWLLSVSLYEALPQFADPTFEQQVRLELTALFLGGLLLVAVLGQYWRCFIEERVSSKPSLATRLWSYAWALAIILLGSGLPAVVGAAAIAAVAPRVAAVRIPAGYPELSLHWAVLSVPAMVSVLSLMIVLKLGIFGRNLRDDHREWWSRLGAWLSIVTLAWLGLFVFAVYSPYALKAGMAPLQKYIVASGGIVWAAWTAAGVLLGKGEKTSSIGQALKNPRVRGLVVALAPYVFIAGLLVVVATGACWALSGVAPADLKSSVAAQAHWTSQGEMWHWLLAGPITFLGLAFLMSCRVDVNEFSMHHFYKNRLVRCYLGASRDRRHDIARRCADPFTGFDSADDLDVADLRVMPCRGDEDLHEAKQAQNEETLRPYVGPLPIINTALNLVQGDDLAWQERKAQSFAFTPLYSGYERGENENGGHDRFAPYGYRPTLMYGYPPFGIGLGTAVAISGAAASPNMGYHSSPAAAFLMTMFNARLGWWMGNPRDKHNWLRSGPRRGLLYLVNELFGLTNDRTHFVNLSDGGHFENLGVYELVRRRCRYIIACDAEQDGALTFNGLGNAIRKCRTDFGVEITVRATRIQPAKDASHSAIHCVVGDIAYPNQEMGTLLYLKASITGDEPADVLEYKARQPAFPHHSTMGDQFFDESQFESYRKLGFHVVQMAFGVPGSENAGLETRFNDLRDYWYPASSAIEQHFGSHAEQYDALLERLRREPELDFIDDAFFQPVSAGQGVLRQPLFVGASMLDLMQRVFIDLDLEHDGQHPHNAGWMTIFCRWARHQAVRDAWQASRHSYGRRFQRFVDGLQNRQ